MTKERELLNIRETMPASKVSEAIETLASSLMKKIDFKAENAAIVGIHTRGAIIARRLADIVRQRTGADFPVGAIDITLYRDDLSTSGIHAIVGDTSLDFEVDDKKIILVDDVLFTGRTIRAAIDEIMDFGRPRSILLAVLIDRGHRELPIAADVAALTIPTKRQESVVLRLRETDGKEEIVLCERKP